MGRAATCRLTQANHITSDEQAGPQPGDNVRLTLHEAEKRLNNLAPCLPLLE